ncbi:hypothetical protein [Streptomyces erythrochromogenes]|uniref:hypothetical protein n=1 Tax=Streptomyces erythrochromogenes TaxID=285574 RepID=UPI0037D937FB
MTAPTRPGPAALDESPRRVWELLALLSEGRTIEQVAAKWGVQAGTVRVYAERMRSYLGADTNAQAVLLGCQAGILDGRRQRHGDHAGYEAHRRRGETPCEACKGGERAHRSRYKGRQKPPEGPAGAPQSPSPTAPL